MAIPVKQIKAFQDADGNIYLPVGKGDSIDPSNVHSVYTEKGDRREYVLVIPFPKTVAVKEISYEENQ